MRTYETPEILKRESLGDITAQRWGRDGRDGDGRDGDRRPEPEPTPPAVNPFISPIFNTL